ncbi:hypothetical protein [Bradyrhizobium cenepequi]
MKMSFRTVAIATATAAFAALFSPGWSEQGGVSLSIKKAEAQARVYIRSPYAIGGGYVRWEGLPWYAVRAYYMGGPWSGPGYSYAGWDDYASRYGIGCRPGTIVKGGDGIDYLCQ